MVDPHPIRRRHRSGQFEFLESLRSGIKPRQIPAKVITEPDHPLRINLQPPGPGIGAWRSPFRDFVCFDVHFADAVMILGIEFGEPDISIMIHSDSVGIWNFREESKFLRLDIELAQRTARTPDISLKISDGRVPARSAGLPSRGVT